jgi:glycosyltransferase involved in cell wall biosynthesis
MKIGLLNPTILIRRPIAELASILIDRGYDVTIITPVSRGINWTPSHYEKTGIKYLKLPCWEIRRLLWSWPSWRAIKMLWKAVSEFEVIQIWAPYYLIAVLPIIFNRLRRRPTRIILTFDTIPGFSFKFGSIIDPLMFLYHRLVGSWLFRLVDARTLYSNILLSYAKQAWLGSAFSIIPTGINLPEFFHRQSILNDKFNIIFIGILNARKGVGVLLRAASMLKVKNIPFHLKIVGDGPDRKEFESLRNILNLQEQVVFMGRVTDVASFFKQADTLILPSYGEGLPGVVMEAMAYGVPVIATNIPCLTELVPNQDFGILVPINDAAAIVEAVEKYMEKSIYRNEVINNARKRIEGLSWGKLLPQYENIYQTLMMAR